MEKTTEQIDKTAKTAVKTAADFLQSRYGLSFLTAVSFLESATPVPLVTDPVLAAYVLVNKTRAVLATITTTLASVLGGLAAYAVAFVSYELIATHFMTDAVGTEFQHIVERVREGVFWYTLIGAFTPIPYTFVALGVGFIEGSIWAFIIASVVGRGVRYAIVAAATYYMGEQALAFAQRQILLASIAVVVVVTFVIAYKLDYV